MERIVLAYSGSVATSAAIPELATQHGAEVVTLTLDLGQARELAAVRERALALGAVRAHVIDAREDFVRAAFLPALAAGALDAGARLHQPLIARRLVDLARMEGASAVAHGGGAALDRLLASLDPSVRVLTPFRACGVAEIESIARRHGIAIPPPARCHIDASLWGRVVTPLQPGPLGEEAFALTRAGDDGPDDAATLEIEFADGLPVRANGVELPVLEMIESLETIAGAHGVGRRDDGAQIVEAPAVAVLHAAHGALVAAVVGEDLARLRLELAGLYAAALQRGDWFEPTRESIDALAGIIQRRVTGSVRLELLKGSCRVVASTHAAGALAVATATSGKVA